MTHHNKCDCGCDRKFGLVRQKWLGYQFATKACKTAYLRVKAQRRRVHRAAAVLYRFQ